MHFTARHFLIRLAIAAAFTGSLSLTAVLPVQAGHSQRHAVISVAKAQLGDPYVWADEGPRTFDCSGLVYFAFQRAGLVDRIGGVRVTAQMYWDWFAARGWASRSDGRRGDLVIWGNGTHIGIYLGRDRVISALPRTGVTIHGLRELPVRFTTFLHVQYD